MEISYEEAGRVLGLLMHIAWLGDQRIQESTMAEDTTE